MNLQIGEDGYCDEFDNNNIITLNNNEDEVIKVATLANGVSIMIRDILCHDEYFQQLEEVKVEGKKGKISFIQKGGDADGRELYPMFEHENYIVLEDKDGNIVKSKIIIDYLFEGLSSGKKGKKLTPNTKGTGGNLDIF